MNRSMVVESSATRSPARSTPSKIANCACSPFLGGEKDFNVPLAGGEQMYQALRSLGIATQLVVYPGQFHGIARPSYQKDRMERYLAWYAKYLK